MVHASPRNYGLLLTLPHRRTADVGKLACAGDGTALRWVFAMSRRKTNRAFHHGRGAAAVLCAEAGGDVLSAFWVDGRHVRGAAEAQGRGLLIWYFVPERAPHDHVAASKASVTSLPSCCSVLARRASLTGSVQLLQDERTIVISRDRIDHIC